jgi:hypothetical protein
MKAFVQLGNTRPLHTRASSKTLEPFAKRARIAFV